MQLLRVEFMNQKILNFFEELINYMVQNSKNTKWPSAKSASYPVPNSGLLTTR